MDDSFNPMKHGRWLFLLVAVIALLPQDASANAGTPLPNDYVVFQLGDNQICILEPGTKRIALLTKGRGPAVVIK